MHLELQERNSYLSPCTHNVAVINPVNTMSDSVTVFTGPEIPIRWASLTRRCQTLPRGIGTRHIGGRDAAVVNAGVEDKGLHLQASHVGKRGEDLT